MTNSLSYGVAKRRALKGHARREATKVKDLRPGPELPDSDENKVPPMES